MTRSKNSASRPLVSVFRMRNRHLGVCDLISLPLMVVLAFALRLDELFSPQHAHAIVSYAMLAPLIKLPLFYWLGLYRCIWTYASLSEMRLILLAAVAGSGLEAAVMFVLLIPAGLVGAVPRSIPFLDVIWTTVALSIPRVALRWAAQYRNQVFKPSDGDSPKRVLIVGAGDAGNQVLRELHVNPQLGLVPVGLVDDDLHKQGMSLSDCSILGTRHDIPRLVLSLHVDRVIIAMPSAGGQSIRELVEICGQAGVEALTVPGIYQLISGEVNVRRIRKIQIEDLLRREPIQIDAARVEALLHGRRVMVTGAGGSIGSELCRQISRCGPRELILLGHGENSIFHIHGELRERFPKLTLHPVIADIRDWDRLDGVFRCFRPGIIFHASAHKHVPLMERNLEDAVTNNVLGTLNLLRLAEVWPVTHFVLISTDKAVNPVSIMGVTKRIAEHLVRHAAERCGRCFVAVRFGNVLGSRGSVVPLFEEQIARGGPVTVTDPEMTRYFMTIPEAVQLVLHAAVLGEGAEVFVLDMGEPLKIVDLARDMIRLAGLREGEDIEIEYTGVRPGDKLHEELFAVWEGHHRTTHEKIFVCNDNANSDRYCSKEQVEALLIAASRADRDEIYRLMKAMVPEYSPVSAASFGSVEMDVVSGSGVRVEDRPSWGRSGADSLPALASQSSAAPGGAG